MSVVVIGCNHHSAPLAALEQMTIAAPDLPKALRALADTEHLSEVVLLSTCNRTEIYAFAERFHGGYADARDFLAQQSGLPPEEVGDHLYAHHGDAAVKHLFGVAAGLDSAVVGEHEILGQVRDAWACARDEGLAGTTLGAVFRHAIETGKRARTETGIARGIASVPQAAVALAERRLGGLDGRSVLVLGAGAMAAGMVRALSRVSADLAIVNRTVGRAAELAESSGGRAFALSQLEATIAGADLILATTGAPEILVHHDVVQRAVTGRDRLRGELVIIDVAVPRDVAPSVDALTGVAYLDMDDVGAFVDTGLAARAAEVHQVREIVEHEVDRYRAMTSARSVAPLVAGLRDSAEAIRLAELERYTSRLGELDPQQREAVEALTKGIVNKLLHNPTVRLKDAAGHARGDRLAEALRDLYDI